MGVPLVFSLLSGISKPALNWSQLSCNFEKTTGIVLGRACGHAVCGMQEMCSTVCRQSADLSASSQASLPSDAEREL